MHETNYRVLIFSQGLIFSVFRLGFVTSFMDTLCMEDFICINFVKWFFLMYLQCLPRIVQDEPLSEEAFGAN